MAAAALCILWKMSRAAGFLHRLYSATAGFYTVLIAVVVQCGTVSNFYTEVAMPDAIMLACVLMFFALSWGGVVLIVHA
ncbi:MAG TPA: hypothetical protein PKA05_15935 [Roseiflexaceae bacterium]|nr:hypothetical protein [Roseiflexaceae bacterium]HMP41871.1 hypothetical protein [Roseiflexaceae bacterium]